MIPFPRKGEGSSVADLRLSFLGYGLLEVWSACVIFNQNSVAEGVTALSSGVGLSYGLHMLLSSFSTIAITLATLLLVLYCRTQDRVRNHAAVTKAATVVNVAGTLLILSGDPRASFVGLVVAGLGNAWLWISWGDIYASLETEPTEFVAMGSVLLQAFLLAVIFAVPQVVQAVLLLVLVPISSGMYLVALRCVDGRVERGVVDERRSSPEDSLSAKFILRFVVGLGAPVALSYFLLSCGFSMPSLKDGIELVFSVGLLVFALVFLGFLRFAPGFDLSSICSVQLTLLVGACLAALAGWRATLGCALVLAATLCSQYFILLYCARLCREGFGNVVLTFGVGQLVNHGCGLLGTLATGVLVMFPSVASTGFTPTKGCLICAVAFFVVVGMRAMRKEAVDPTVPMPVDEARIQEGLLRIAKDGHLSARETEVFLLLAKGRSAPFIRDELMVSLNTVSSHVKHIYGKLGVHSRQELIDLVEEAARSR